MSMTEARKRANKKWDKDNIERINVVIKKGDKERIKQAAADAGMSVNGFLNKAINNEIDKAREPP